MKRDIAREIAVQLLFADKFGDIELDSFLTDDNFKSLLDDNNLYSEKLDLNSSNYIKSVISKYKDNSETILNCIASNLNNWDINRLSGTALACLKCAVTELLYFDDIPNGATINSILDISKKYDDNKTVSFINGILGSISKGIAR